MANIGAYDTNDDIFLNDDNDLEPVIPQSNYYDIEDLCKLMESIDPKLYLSVLNLNARSLIRNFDEYKILLAILPNLFDIITIEETWLNEDLEALVVMENYHFISKPKLMKKEGGGLGIYIKDGINYKHRNDLCNQNREHFDSMFLEIINSSKGSKNTIIGLLYRSPNNNCLHEFIQYIKHLTDILTKENKEIVLTGDTNLDLKNYSSKQYIAEYLDSFLSSGFQPKITLPTRVTHHSATIIDHMFVKLSVDECHAGTLRSDITDHFINFLFMKSKSPPNKMKYISYRPLTNNNICKFNEALNSCDMSPILCSEDPNEAYNKLLCIYQTKLDEVIPIKTVRFNKYHHKIEPWMTKEILDSIRIRDKLNENMLKSTPMNYESAKTKYTKHRNALNKVIKVEKRRYNFDQFNKSKHDIKSMWNNINRILNKTRNKLDFPDAFTDGDITLTNLNDIVDSFNKYYVNVGPNLATKIKPGGKYKFTLPVMKHAESFFFFPCDSQEIQSIIRLMRPKLSHGYDNISPKLLKSSYLALLDPLTHVINISLKYGTVPDAMKKARVIPIFKNNGSNRIMKNYRPVSLLPVFSKILERIVYNRLFKYLNKHILLAISQYGFREGLSTELAILELQDRICNIISKGSCCAGIFMDLSKAFDTLDHTILLAKLEHYGVRGLALQWFKSYLHNRCQYVQLNDNMSSTLKLTCGVPQGSILGPILFLLYINDLAHIKINGVPILFADDTNTLYEQPSYESLRRVMNRDLQILSDWFAQNKLSINETKTKYIIFFSKHNAPPENFEIYLNDIQLERVGSTKFLGVYIEQTLSWKVHIDSICSRISRITGVLSRLKFQLPGYVLQTMYNSLFSSVMLYGLSIWGSSPKSHLDRIVKLQKKAVRHIGNAKYNSHTDPLFRNLKILKLHDAYKLQCCKLLYRKRLGTLHDYHSARLPLISRSRTRQLNDVLIFRTRTMLQTQSINYKIGHNWNSLPFNIKNEPIISLKSFSKKLKLLFINKYQTHCSTSGCYVCRHFT